MGLLEVYSNPEKPEILCSLIDDKGNKKEIMLIKLQDNGIHVYKTQEHYILPPVPQIDSLIRDVIEEVAEELKVDSIVYNSGNDDSNSNSLVLSNDWFDVERLALASSKHVALSSEIDSRVIVSIVKFSNNTFASTVLRKEDSFPILQIFMDTSYNPPLIKIYNELGQVVESRREYVSNFEDYIKGLINEDEYAIVYRELLDYNFIPAENSTENGKKLYVGCIFKYIISFNTEKRSIIIKKRKLARVLKAILYLDKLVNNVGVEVIIGNLTDMENLDKNILKLKTKAEKLLGNKFKITNVSYYGDSMELIKNIKDVKKRRNENSSNKEILYVLPIVFIVVADSKRRFEEYVERIIKGPTSDGLELLDEYFRQNLSSSFVAYLANLEEILILYNDIIEDLDDQDE
ncbi:hypothetical protein BFU36_10360 [Sulfolobus sp. A20]|uniref:hypothetical protein n=1 Tax=Sulfolobaceae TaxID=118883 RepID=UPI000845C64E|nr:MULTISPECIES: hypothetical protein [unclassified Sulfolobus]TRM77516.1 hypothetical protein DJ532_04360 [Sulfolobus sp. A20-N-F8]TRM79330.1 hypothetical protein DJ528_01595 [Sulfolobus sp. B5]TRM82997.1 hypothetical protein DJ531_07405 [Sulfolobus sp. A20-N-F6]TRM99809.1 hypothetical protein DJ530_08270 [Sulfolobus sp. E1]AOL17043.1 hypothetical protein BFU36_10360 [Sulfolobus sp. A20]